MRVLAAFLVCWSVLAVETVTQTVAVSANNPKTFRLRSVNEGRGAMDATHIYKIRAGYALGQMTSGNIFRFNSSGEVLDQSVLPLPAGGFSNEYFLVSGNLILGFVKTEIQSPPTSGSFAFSSTSSPDFNGPEIVFTPVQDFIGSANLELIYRTSGNADIQIVQVTFNITNDAPVIALFASPSLIVSGSEVSLSTTISDANGHSISVSYDYGDGQTGTSATHVYAAPGVYTVTATANDGFGGTATAQASVTVVGTDHLPTARFTSSDAVAFVNVPFVLDATTSTDPQNGALTYVWNFGDGTPNGAQMVQPHVYTQAGAVTVSLTVTDAEGFTSTISREIEVLEESAAATFDSEIRVTTTYFPLKTNKDIISVFARVNIGDTQLSDGAAVALEYAGKRYTANLNKRGKAIGWTVKQNLRRQTPGTVEVTFKAKNTAIASLLAGLGAVNDADLNVPFRLELGAKTIQIDVPTLFDVGLARGKAFGELE